MKKLILITMLLFSIPVFSNSCLSLDRKKIYLKENIKAIKNYRDLLYAVAIYNSELSVVELECSDIKEVEVFILDASGEIISSGFFDSSMNPYFAIDVPEQSGTYWIVINSPLYYAEGYFEK